MFRYIKKLYRKLKRIIGTKMIIPSRKELSAKIAKLEQQLSQYSPFADFQSKMTYDKLQEKISELQSMLDKAPKQETQSAPADHKLQYDELKDSILNLTKRIEEMKLNLEALAAEVTRAQTVQDSAVKLLKSLTDELSRISAQLAEQAAKQAVAPTPEPIDTSELDAFVSKLKDSTDALAGAVKDSSDVIPTQTVVLNAEDDTKPTVAVILPEVLPEHVEVTAEKVVDTVDTTSSEPQIVITVTEDKAPEAPAEVPEVQAEVKTDAGEVDVQVTAPVAEVEAVKAEGVDVVEAVQEAYDAAPEVKAEPEAPAEEPAPVEGAPA